MLSNLRERCLSLFNSNGTPLNCQPWSTIIDVEFHPDVSSLYKSTNILPIQSIQSDYLPRWISYLWPLAHQGKNVWAVDHPTSKETISIPFVMKYDLLIWNIFYRFSPSTSSIRGDSIYPQVLIVVADWSTGETTLKHLKNVQTDLLKKVRMSCVYEGQNFPDDLYRSFLRDGCDLLICTPLILHDLIQRRNIHFEQLKLIVYDQIDNLIDQVDHLNELFHHLDLHTNHQSSSIQHLIFSRVVNEEIKDFLSEKLRFYAFLSSSMLETFSYQNYFLYCEPCRNWSERKHVIGQALDLAKTCEKKVVMCAGQARRLATMQSILNDHSVQSILLHSQLSSKEIDEILDEWQNIRDRPLVLLIQDEVLNDLPIDNADVIIHLDVQRMNWYQIYDQRLKFISKSFVKANPMKKAFLNSLKSFEDFYKTNESSSTIPLVIFLWPGDCAQVTYELVEYLKQSKNFVHPLVERLARNNCHETILAKIDVEFCPTLKCFGRCSNASKLKRCAYRHAFHREIDSIELRPEDESLINANLLSSSFELFLPDRGEIELQITNVADGNRLYAQILRSRNDTNETLKIIFDYEKFQDELRRAFEQVKNRPLNEIVPGEIYFYFDENQRIHRVYVYEQERNYFDIRRSDAILNRLTKFSQVEEKNDEIEKRPADSTATISKTKFFENSNSNFTVFSLDTGMTLTLTSNERLFPIEPVTLKKIPPLAVEIILCQIGPLDKIHMSFTPFTIETVRSLTLNEIFMGRIQLATRSCFWIDPLVKPVRLASLKRIVYEKAIRKQLFENQLIEINENHMTNLQKLAVEAQIKEEPVEVEVEVEENSTNFQPFVNRRGQLIINPLGRSKEFFSKHQKAVENESPPAPSMPVVENVAKVETNELRFPKDLLNRRHFRCNCRTDQDDPDQMLFIFGPKLYSQLRQIKEMEDEQRRQADFPVQRNRNRHHRSGRPTHTNNENKTEEILAPNMSRYEPFVGERGAFTQEQIDYKQSQRKTRLFWEQTSRDVYLTIGFYNVDSTQTRVEFHSRSIYCRTKIRQYDRFVRIHLSEEILPDKSSFQVRRSNILVTLRKSHEGRSWSTLTTEPLEPRPEFFTIDYGSDDESDNEKSRRKVNRQWERIREEKRENLRSTGVEEDKFYLDELDDYEQDERLARETTTTNVNENELTETSSDCHSTDSDDCYYEDQVPANHIPRGYDEADYDHRFYSSQTRT